LDVSIYEEHSKIGSPVQCTGLLTKEITKVIDLLPKNIILNNLKELTIYSKNNSVKLNVDEIVIDREKFDQFLAKKAKETGCKIFLNHKFLDYKNNNIFLLSKGKVIKQKTDVLIGADGPISRVAKRTGLFKKREYYIGLQARVKGNFSYEVYLGSIAPKFFAWIVPESDKIARIGLATKKNPTKCFLKFLKIKNISAKQIIEKQSGLIPIFNPKQKIKKKRKVFLIGDAALQVKATTGGGLIPGFKAAEQLFGCLAYGLWYNPKKLNKELKLHLRIRKILNKFSDKDYNKLLKLLNQEKVKKILKKYNRDQPIELIFNLLKAEPKFLIFSKKIFRYIFK
jgi:flavin-dependent dehydrogenase